MKTIIVDDEFWAVDQLKEELEQEEDIEICGCFFDGEEAWEYAKDNPVDFALLDVKMFGMDGLELGQKLREKSPDVIIVYVSSYPEYFSDAFRKVRADYYILKPYRHQDVKDVLERARLLSRRQRKRVRIRTFGRFDVFIDGQVVQFRNNKAKELLAICVDRKGGNVTLEEAIDKLWEGTPVTENVKARYRKAVAYLNTLFEGYGLKEIFENGYGFCYINKQKVECDYYEFLESNDSVQFLGEYMQEYSWAEETTAWLAMQKMEKKFRADKNKI